MLAVGAAGKEHVLGTLGQVGQRGQDRRELAQKDLVRMPHLEELAGLGDVLGGGAPVHVATGLALTGAIELPDQRHQRMAGAGQALAHRGQVEEGEVRLGDDLARGRLRDDLQLGLGQRERGLDVQPRLKARRLREEGPYAGVVDAERGRLLEHGRFSRTAGGALSNAAGSDGDV